MYQFDHGTGAGLLHRFGPNDSHEAVDPGRNSDGLERSPNRKRRLKIPPRMRLNSGARGSAKLFRCGDTRLARPSFEASAGGAEGPRIASARNEISKARNASPKCRRFGRQRATDARRTKRRPSIRRPDGASYPSATSRSATSASVTRTCGCSSFIAPRITPYFCQPPDARTSLRVPFRSRGSTAITRSLTG